jgi:hypothetical protein
MKFTHSPMKMEQIERSEMLATKLHAGEHPKTKHTTFKTLQKSEIKKNYT